jgi:hypothetical protein
MGSRTTVAAAACGATTAARTTSGAGRAVAARGSSVGMSYASAVKKPYKRYAERQPHQGGILHGLFCSAVRPPIINY